MLLTVFTKFLEGARHELLAISVEFRSEKHSIANYKLLKKIIDFILGAFNAMFLNIFGF